MWLATFVALIGIKSNRKAPAWLIFVPVLAVYLVWTIAKKTFVTNPSLVQILDVIFDGLIFGQAIMWLLAGKLSGQSRFANCIMSLVVMAAVGMGAVVSSLGVRISMEQITTGIALVIMFLAMVSGQGIAGFICRRKYSIVKFSLLAALWEILIITSLMAVYGVVALIIMLSTGDMQAGVILFGIMTSSVVLGAIVYVISLPFLILVQKNQFWRQSFLNWTRVAQPQPVVIEQTAQNP